ncbi:MAG: ribonuclease P protein subunit [Candidatus Thermoplasmatota archaeon]|jgi:RNase P/RNase MRP subunit p29|nr:ribonuclease P protein subunit [Candidatus Thermoplasmatota archaeon]
MSGIIQLPWLARKLEVTESTDPTLVGVSGVVQDETRRTITIQSPRGMKTLAKDTIRFKIDDVEIDGSKVGQRPEERVGKRYRRN